jgi:hypothetical protein
MGFDAGTNTRCMLQSLEHDHPVVNGYSGLRPPFFAALVDAASMMPEPESLLALHEIGVRYLVAERPLAVRADVSNVLVERAQFGEERIYELVWSPAIEAALEADTGEPPPAPGAPPYGVGEAAVYEVRWTSGPMSVPAGEATISVATPKGAEAFRFVISAKTTDWVSRFFEADATLETTANQDLLPVMHQEVIVEGRRRVDRRLEFDFLHREVRMTTGGAEVTLPLAASARDPITALFYVRALALMEGLRLSLPLSDNGRRSRLDVAVIGQETVLVRGQSQRAWKIEPRIRARVERQAPLVMTGWLSADDRRIPLRIDVTAPFGSVQAELVSYRAGR